MQSRLTEKRDIKVFILYLLRYVGRPLSYRQLHDICVGDGIVGSFDFTGALGELIDTENVTETATPDGDVYEITESGVRVSRYMSGDILRSIRETGKRAAVRLLNFAADGSSARSSVGEEDEDGNCPVYCEIVRGGKTLLKLEISAASENEARYMKEAFDAEPEKLLMRTYELLTGSDRAGIRSPDPDVDTFRA